MPTPMPVTILTAAISLFLGYLLRTSQTKDKSDKLSLFFLLYFSSTRGTRGRVHKVMPFDTDDLGTENLVAKFERFVENGLDDAIKIMDDEA